MVVEVLLVSLSFFAIETIDSVNDFKNIAEDAPVLFIYYPRGMIYYIFVRKIDVCGLYNNKH